MNRGKPNYFDSLFSQLKEKLPNLEIHKNEAIAKYTPIKAGGKTKILINIRSSNSLLQLLLLLKKRQVFNKIPVIIAGGLTNTIFPNNVFRGILIRSFSLKKPTFSKTEITADSGYSLKTLIDKLTKKGISGLEIFTGIPGTIVGAVTGNIHGFGGVLFSNFIKKIKVFNLKNGKTEYLKSKDCRFAYNQSIFKKNNKLIILEVRFSLKTLKRKNREEVKKTIDTILEAKKNQPQNSLGCAFSNLSKHQQKKHNFPTNSTGWFIENKLNLKGFVLGDFKISENHANFIVPADSQKRTNNAGDYLALIKKIKKAAWSKFHLRLKPEVKIISIPKNFQP